MINIDLTTLSPYVGTLLILLYIYYPFTRPIFYIHMIIIFLIGTLDSFIKWRSIENYNPLFSFLGHLFILFPLFFYKKMYIPNIKSYLLNIIIVITLYLMPYWAYSISKIYFIMLYIILFLCISIAILHLKNKRCFIIW